MSSTDAGTMRALAKTWNPRAPIEDRMAVARAKLVELSEAAGVDAPKPVEATA